MKHPKIKYKQKCANSWCKNYVQVTHGLRMYCKECIKAKAFEYRDVKMDAIEVSEWM